MDSKAELINSKEFDSILENGVQLKKTVVTTYKNKNKLIYKDFVELMHKINPEVQRILKIKKNKRSESDNKILKDYSREISALYKQTQDLCLEEKNNKQTKIEKIVSKVTPVIKMLRYIDNIKLEEAFEKAGIQISFVPLEEQYIELKEDSNKEFIKNIFNAAKQVKQKMIDHNEYIETEIYESIPYELKYNKDTCLDGLKNTDFKKLVDVKTQLSLINDKEEIKNVTDKIDQVVENKQFDISRTELVRDKLITISEQAQEKI